MIDLGRIETGLQNIEGFIGEKAIAIAARVIKERILTLTSQGLDYQGNQFPQVSSFGHSLGAYSYAYGRKRYNAGKQIAVRDLYFSGDMLNSIYFIPYTDGGVLTMPDEQMKIAEYNEQWGAHFFNASEETVQMACNEIEIELQAEIDGWIGNE